MPKVYKIKKGLDIKLVGEADKIVTDFQAEKYAIKPQISQVFFLRCLLKKVIR